MKALTKNLYLGGFCFIGLTWALPTSALSFYGSDNIHISSVPANFHCAEEKLTGLWQFTHVVYRGQTMPRPNPRLIMYFQFDGEGESRLYWHRQDEAGFCESRSQYVYNNCYLHKEVVWYNPDSRADCKTDPDMTEGNRTVSRLTFLSTGQMKLYLPLGDETIVYLWSQIEEDDSQERSSQEVIKSYELNQDGGF